MFSVAGSLVTKTRARLGDDSFDSLVFFKKYYDVNKAEKFTSDLRIMPSSGFGRQYRVARAAWDAPTPFERCVTSTVRNGQGHEARPDQAQGLR